MVEPAQQPKPPAARWWLAGTIIVLAAGAGVAIAMSPPAWEQRVTSLLLAICLPLAALRAGLVSILQLRARHYGAALLTALLAILIALLSLAAIGYCVEAWGE